MKKLIFIIVLIVIAAWVGYYFFYKDEAGLGLEKIAKTCQLNDGDWIKEHKECEYAEKRMVFRIKGRI